MDSLLREAVYELFTAGLDVHTALGLLSCHTDLARDRLYDVVSRVDGGIKAIHQAQVRTWRDRSSADAVLDVLGELATGRAAVMGLQAWLSALARRCATVVGADAVGFVVDTRQAEPHLIAAHPDVAALRPLCEPRGGPCEETCRTGLPVTVPDLADESARWPGFAARGRPSGFRAMRTLPLRPGGATVGAMVLVSATGSSAFAGDNGVAQALADMAALAVVREQAECRRGQVAEHVKELLDDRAVFEQARGILAERHGLSIADSTSMMAEHAHLHGKSLLDVAHEVVDGALHGTM